MPDGSLGFVRDEALVVHGRSAMPRRAALGVVILAAAVAGFLVTGPHAQSLAVAEAGADLTRLLRAMAAMKAAAGMALVGAVLWRLARPAPAWRLAAYAMAGAAIAAGPGLIWGMAHVRLGALLLHAGLFATVVLLWRDPETGRRLESVIAMRRARLQERIGPAC